MQIENWAEPFALLSCQEASADNRKYPAECCHCLFWATELDTIQEQSVSVTSAIVSVMEGIRKLLLGESEVGEATTSLRSTEALQGLELTEIRVQGGACLQHRAEIKLRLWPRGSSPAQQQLAFCCPSPQAFKVWPLCATQCYALGICKSPNGSGMVLVVRGTSGR